ncbi:MAG: hypothetical protein PHV34_05905 [Verrucomicrobiae bacterium]|nr:hypothetical protein [Verrucomicrobiae bacterium]
MILDAIHSMFETRPEAAKCFVKLIGIRGYRIGATGQNQIGRYDDLIIRVMGDDLAEFPASTDPGRYYIRHPANPRGCAMLRPGLWWYELGVHKGHAALTQADAVDVDRLDQNGDMRGADRGDFGINIHSGGSEDEVGAWSAGCQIIKTETPWRDKWLDFYEPLAAKVRSIGQSRIPYLLVDRLCPVRWSVNDPGAD